MRLISGRQFVFLVFCLIIFILFAVFSYETVLAEESNAYETTKVPIILSRSLWENNPQLKNLLQIQLPGKKAVDGIRPVYYPASRIIIHDNACQIYLPSGLRNPNCNSYEQEAISLIQNIYRYHVLNKKYKDIGYHFIIGWDGRIFEGRYGGNNIVGDHYYQEESCRDYSLSSIGVLLLANLETEEPSLEMKNSLERLVAWLAMANDLDINASAKDVLVWQDAQTRTATGEYFCQKDQGKILQLNSKNPALIYYQSLVPSASYQLNMRDLRETAANLVKQFNKYLYKKQNDSSVWEIRNGYQIKESKVGSRVITLNDNQLDYFSSITPLRIKEGDLIKLCGRDNIYLVQNASFREILSRQIFEMQKLK